MGKVSIETIRTNVESDRKYRERRHGQWKDNYALSRDTVELNRLTQRESVNMPYMKGTLKAFLAKTNGAPDLEFDELDNDGQKTIYINAYWQDLLDRCKAITLDYIDRKQEALYGRSFAKLNIIDGKIVIEILDPQDVLLDRFMKPYDIESGSHCANTGIFVNLSDLKLNQTYDQAVVSELETYFASPQGLIKAAENARLAAEKAQRMETMGVPDVQTPTLGTTVVEINEHYYKVWNEATQEREVVVIVTALDKILMEKPMREILGVNFFPICTWAGDVEATDIWSDGLADTVRPLNMVANARWSQKVENGTLVNFGMNFYDSSIKEEWRPSGYEPEPFGFYPLPGNPNEMLKRVEIEEMGNVYEELSYIKTEIESFSATTKSIKGESSAGDQTLGEFQSLLQQADEILDSSTPLREQYWKDIGDKFAAILNACADELEEVELHKQSASGRYFTKKLHPKKIKSAKGYKCKVNSKVNREKNDLRMIQKLTVAQATFPGNAPLDKIRKKRVLDWLKLSPEERRQVLEFDAQAPAIAAAQVGPDGKPMLPTPVGPSAGAVPSFIPPRQVNA